MRKNGLSGYAPNFGPEWTLREARRLAWDNTQQELSRLSALQELLGRPDDIIATWEVGSPQRTQGMLNNGTARSRTDGDNPSYRAAMIDAGRGRLLR